MSRAVAVASAALRRLAAAASRPAIVARGISTGLAVARRSSDPLFRRSSPLFFRVDASRGYAQGRRAPVESEDEDSLDEDLRDEDLDDDEMADFDSEGELIYDFGETGSDSE